MLKNILYLSIFTAFAVLSWLGFNIYHNFSSSTISTATNIKIVPITPAFDAQTVSNLKSRKPISANLDETITLPEVKSNSSRPSPTPAASGSAVFQIPVISSTPSSQISQSPSQL